VTCVADYELCHESERILKDYAAHIPNVTSLDLVDALRFALAQLQRIIYVPAVVRPQVTMHKSIAALAK